MIPLAAPASRIARYRTAVDAAIASVIESPSYILGSAVANFEAGFAAYIGTAHCIGVNSGTDALAFSLRALGIGSGLICPRTTPGASIINSPSAAKNAMSYGHIWSSPES